MNWPRLRASLWSQVLGLSLLSARALLACSSTSDGMSMTAPGSPTVGGGLSDPQIPPQNAAELATWLDSGFSDAWAHEPAVHAARAPSPHEPNQIFENELMANSAATDDYPRGAAAVKLLFASDQRTVTGRSVQVKVKAGSSDDAWYWYQRGGSLSADGVGASQCAGCHSGASDFVFTQVSP